MTIFKSRQVNLDPEPWEIARLSGWGRTAYREFDAYGHELPRRWNPRPEFEPTRDPYPWRCGGGPGHTGLNAPENVCRSRDHEPHIHIWSPRREQYDTPVNPIIAGVRDDMEGSADLGHDLTATVEFWLSCQEDWQGTPEQIEHARRVLTRLAALE